MFKEKVLDLTGLHEANFAGRIRVRNLFDWAHDYWSLGVRLSVIRLSANQFENIKNEMLKDNMYIKEMDNKSVSIDLGYGIINVQRDTLLREKI